MAGKADPAQSKREISRNELLEVVGRALAKTECADSTREKIFAVAETTDAVAVGWFHCDGVGCPARQAGRHHKVFQTEFDLAMAAHFDIGVNLFAPQHLFAPFVAVVA